MINNVNPVQQATTTTTWPETGWESQTVLMNRGSLAVCTVPGVLSAIASDICYLLQTSGFTIHPQEEETQSWRQTEVKG